mmetsp:Transcript_52270/g.62975  ORF Transcript_52270/g.62975 Transcript_52270/m.62975 type:complete len:148 (-) Transcript_52270:446-889(-)
MTSTVYRVGKWELTVGRAKSWLIDGGFTSMMQSLFYGHSCSSSCSPKPHRIGMEMVMNICDISGAVSADPHSSLDYCLRGLFLSTANTWPRKAYGTNVPSLLCNSTMDTAPGSNIPSPGPRTSWDLLLPRDRSYQYPETLHQTRPFR